MIIEIAVGRSKYKIECPENEQAKLMHLAGKLDEKVKKSLNHFQNIDDKTLLVITALTLEDELESKVRSNDEDVANDKINEEDMYDVLAENIENVTDYIENLAKKIENY